MDLNQTPSELGRRPSRLQVSEDPIKGMIDHLKSSTTIVGEGERAHQSPKTEARCETFAPKRIADKDFGAFRNLGMSTAYKGWGSYPYSTGLRTYAYKRDPIEFWEEDEIEPSAKDFNLLGYVRRYRETSSDVNYANVPGVRMVDAFGRNATLRPEVFVCPDNDLEALGRWAIKNKQAIDKIKDGKDSPVVISKDALRSAILGLYDQDVETVTFGVKHDGIVYVIADKEKETMPEAEVFALRKMFEQTKNGSRERKDPFSIALEKNEELINETDDLKTPSLMNSETLKRAHDTINKLFDAMRKSVDSESGSEAFPSRHLNPDSYQDEVYTAQDTEISTPAEGGGAPGEKRAGKHRKRQDERPSLSYYSALTTRFGRQRLFMFADVGKHYVEAACFASPQYDTYSAMEWQYYFRGWVDVFVSGGEKRPPSFFAVRIPPPTFDVYELSQLKWFGKEVFDPFRYQRLINRYVGFVKEHTSETALSTVYRFHKESGSQKVVCFEEAASVLPTKPVFPHAMESKTSHSRSRTSLSAEPKEKAGEPNLGNSSATLG